MHKLWSESNDVRYLCHVHGQEVLRRHDRVLSGRPDDHLAVGGFEGDEQIGREIRMRVLQHQISGDRARVSYTGVGSLLYGQNQVMALIKWGMDSF